MNHLSSDLETSAAPPQEATPAAKPRRRSAASADSRPGEEASPAPKAKPKAKRAPRKRASTSSGDESQGQLPLSAEAPTPRTRSEAPPPAPADPPPAPAAEAAPERRREGPPREFRDRQESRGDFRENREGRDNRESREPRENRDNREGRDNRDFREQRGEGRDRDHRKFRKKNRHKKKHQQHQNGGPGHPNGGYGGGEPRQSRQQEQDFSLPEIEPTGPPVEVQGLVEISPKGFGFLRQRDRGFAQSPLDVFVTPEVVRIHGLRDGLMVKCVARQGQRGPQLTEILSINGQPPEKYHQLPYFEELTAINPNKRIVLETRPDRATTRVIDLMTPIGRGQRGLIVAPPRTGKTTIIQHIAEAVQERYPGEIHLMILLIDERPEEVTDFQRSFPNADIMASSNDSDIKSHTRIAQLAIERAKRLVEAGEHVFLLLDSITRLARAFNNAASGGNGGNRGTQSGGIAVGALEIPRRLFAAARNTREGGSLTIVATALIQTNSKMDEAIFQEFKGTGNMELVLDRQVAQNYVYPAVDIHRSGTRREELLLPAHMLEKIHFIRRGLAGYKPVEAMEWMLKLMERYPNNAQMLVDLKAPHL